MGSTISTSVWIVLAAIGGALYLTFDAARYFAQRVGAVGLRRLAGDDDDVQNAGSWRRYDVDNFQLVSGSLLQVTLLLSVIATFRAAEPGRSGAMAAALVLAIWMPAVLFWKVVLALVPEDAGELVVHAMIPVSHFFYLALWPVLRPLRRAVERMDQEAEENEEGEEPTDAEVQAYIDVGEEEGILEPAEGKLLQSIFDFGDRLAREIMTPRIDVLAVDARQSLQDVARVFSESKYSRIPIYRDSIDQIIGIVHIKDLFEVILKGDERTLADIARVPYVVSESKKVSELLREFQSEHIQAAVVVDEYGGTAGLVTIEDVIEEIVGEIADEHEEEEPTIVDMSDGTYLVSGLLRVDELDERLEADLTGDDYETVAGLIFTSLGRVPAVGTVMKRNGWQFSVERADRRRIYRVRVSPDPQWQLHAAAGEERA